MNKRNNLYLLISLMGMTIILFAIVYFGNNHDKIDIDKNLFKVADQTKIDRVILKRSNEKIELQYNGSKWMLNTDFEADRQLIQVFFATLLQAEPKRPIAQRLQDSVHQHINTQGTEVILYQGDTQVKSFLVSGNGRKTETYYELAGETTPYLVTIPGYRVYVAAIFELPLLAWRDKRIFNFNWQNFKRLTATFHQSESESFVISFQDRFFGLEGMNEADTTKLNDFLDAVSLVQAMQFLSKDERKVYDSSKLRSLYYTIEATDIANRSYSLDLYEPNKQDAAILGKLGDGQALLISRDDFIRLDRKKSHFKK